MNDNLEKMLEKYSIETCHGCNEPGYDDKPVCLANWNNIPQKVYDALEFMGYSCEWEDEWTMCGQCYKVVRTSPSSYGWTRYWAIIGDCELICGDCLKDDPTDYLEELENNPKHCLTFDLDLEELGYVMIEEDFENGWHPGQDDDPKTILERLLKDNPEGKYIFNLDEQSQFYIGFSIWKKIE